MNNVINNKYFGKVGTINVEGKTYKEFTLNYLKAVIETHKELPMQKRLRAYILFFVNKFSYDKSMRDKILNRKDEIITKELKEERLFNLCNSNKGVCEQLSQAFALLTFMDKELSKEINVYECDFTISVKGKEMAHATNLVVMENKVYLLDISSMIHCKEKDYSGDIWDYGMVLLENYIENQKQNDFQIVPNTLDKKGTYLLCYKNNLTEDIEGYYDILTLTADTINNDFKRYIIRIDISSYVKGLLSV